MQAAEYVIRRRTEAYLLDTGASFTQIHRLDVILDRHFDVCDMFDNVATMNDEDSPYGPDEHRALTVPGWVYALTTWKCEVGYIGKTKGRLQTRMKSHWNRPQWEDRSELLMMDVDILVAWNVGDACDRLERAAILALQPPLNVVGVERW